MDTPALSALTDAVAEAIAGDEVTAMLANPSEARRPHPAGNADFFAEHFGSLFRYQHDRGHKLGWRIWDDRRWAADDTNERARAMDWVSRVNRYVAEMLWAAGVDDKVCTKWDKWAESGRDKVEQCLKIAGTRRPVASHTKFFDTNPWLFSCANGTLDLRTGELSPPNPTDMLSKGTNIEYHADAKAPRWELFLSEVFAGERTLADYMRRAVGYSLTGDMREHALFILHGPAGTGKSTFIHAIKTVLGDFFDSAANLFTGTGSTNARGAKLAGFHGKRFVQCSETNAGDSLDEALIKQVTGGDQIGEARFLYANPFSYTPQWKIWIGTNHLPRVLSDAMWRRVRPIPFDVQFTADKDTELWGTLTDEAPGILAWAVQGCLEWQQRGLAEPLRVLADLDAYRSHQDKMSEFIDEFLTFGSHFRGQRALTVQAACAKFMGIAVTHELQAELGRRLREKGREKGVEVVRRNPDGKKTYDGFKLVLPK